MTRQILLDGAVLLLDGAANGSAELISQAAGRVLDIPPQDVTVTHACAHCGSTEHGRPGARLSGAASALCWVSFSAAAGYAVAAACARSAIGVDIESVARISAHHVDDVLLHPEERRVFEDLEPDRARRYLASLWVSKEAVVKSTGVGLRVDLTGILIRLDGNIARLESWPEELALASGCRISLFTVTDDVVGALAVQF